MHEKTQIFNSPNYIENQVNDVISKGSFNYLSTIQTKPYLEIFRVSWLLADREMSTWRSQRVGWWYLFLQMVSTQKLEYH